MTRPLPLILLATLTLAIGCQSENSPQQRTDASSSSASSQPAGSSPSEQETEADPSSTPRADSSASDSSKTASPPSSDGPAPSGDLAALRDRLAQDQARKTDAGPSQSEIQEKQAELRELARKLLQGVSEKGRPAIDAYLMSPDTIDGIYMSTHASIMKMSLDQRRDAAWSKLAETIGAAHPQFLTVQLGNVTRAEAGPLFKRDTWTAKDLTIEFLVAGVPHRTILRTAVLTDSGWRFLQYETKGPYEQ